MMKTFVMLITMNLLAALPLFAQPADTLRLSLRQAMDTARVTAFQVRTAKSRTQETDARVEEMRGALLPHLGATASDVLRSFNVPALGFSFPGIPELVEPFNAQDARVTGHLALWNGPAWKKFQAARQDQESDAWEQQAVEENVALDAADAYLVLSRARSLIKAREMELDMATQLDALTQAQKKAGTATQIEVLRSAGQVSTAQGALAAALGGEEQARYALLRALGMNLETYPELSDTLALRDEGSENPAASLPAAVNARPEVAAADKHAEAAASELGALRSEMLPTVDLYGDYGLSGRRLHVTDTADWTETVALQLTWNLWDGGERQARLGQKREKLRQAELLQRDTRTAVEQEIRTAAAFMRSSREQAVHAQDRVRLAEAEARLAEELFRTGASGNLEVITAQGSVVQAHEAFIDALYNFNKARLEFLWAAHRLSDV